MPRGTTISANTVVVALFGLAMSFYVAIAHRSALGFLVLLVLTAVAACLVNYAKTKGTNGD
ncbi:MAG: hypothetical protein MR654_09150 [Corynebacterium glucuronolyticum]|nr:hypothetical protein [Corynebacterium glucuronolyticum]